MYRARYHRAMDKPLDVLIIGAGHNGLTCACYLAAAGLSVRVVERRSVVGGAAVTEEFFPGFRNSTASYTVSLLNPQVIRDLRLAQHGLRIVERPISNFVPLADGRYLKFGDAAKVRQRPVAEVAKFSPRDAQRLPSFYARLDRIADQLRQWILQSPPNLGGPFVVEGWRDLIAAAKLLLQVGRLPREGQRDLVDVFTKSAGDWLDSWFESEPLKAVLGWDSIVGNYASPYAPGSAYVLLHHVFGEVNGKRGKWGHAIGGMGAITQAMAAEARARGVQVDVDQPVQRVIVENGRATGVELKSGEVVRARAVAANVTPKLLYQRLVDSAALPADFVEAIGRTKYGSGTFRINVALSELPDFSALPGISMQPHHASGITFAPSLAYMDRAWHDAVAAWILARAGGRDVDSKCRRRLACTAGTTRRQPVLPAVRADRGLVVAERARSASDLRRGADPLPELSRIAAWLSCAVAGRSGKRIWVDRRRHLPWPTVARSTVLDAAGAGLRALSRANRRPVSLRFRSASGWRRDRCAGT